MRGVVSNLLGPTQSRSATAAVRLSLLLVALVVATIDRQTSALLFIVMLAALGVLATRLPPGGFIARSLRVVEAFVATGTGALASDSSPLVSYLLAPAFAAGAACGVFDTLLVCLLGGGGGLLVDGLTGSESTGDEAAQATQWLALSLAAGLVGAWVRRLITDIPNRDDAYHEAYRLLTQLRTVSRTLPAGLDAPTLAEALLDSTRALLPFDRGAVLARSQGERLQPLAIVGTDRLDWDIDLAGSGPVAEAWASQRTQVRARTLAPNGRSGRGVVVPLRVGLRTVGLLAVESDSPEPLPNPTVVALEQLSARAALRLETALLFDEVRSVATSEERRRLAREIHDGVAQELASLGYAIDAVVADLSERDRATVELVRSLRTKVTELVSELRMSIFDLRAEVDQHGGLGAALSEYVRAVGATSPLTVHLSLDEGTLRLPARVEAELLRIAQEAITNARRHSGAQNLWVTCRVAPPAAVLRVEDDGAGLKPGRHDSFGLNIMRERAARLHADISVRARESGGTVVEVTLGDVTGTAANLDSQQSTTR